MSDTYQETPDARSDLPPHITRGVRPDTPAWTSLHAKHSRVHLHIGTAYRVRIDIHRAAVGRLITLLSDGLCALDAQEAVSDTAAPWPGEQVPAGGEGPPSTAHTDTPATN